VALIARLASSAPASKQAHAPQQHHADGPPRA